MLKLVCLIKIGALVFDFIHEVEIETSLRDKTDTAIIKQAKKVFIRTASDYNSKPAYEVIKRGDAVEIYLGYDGKLNLEFKGYVKQVNPKTPIEIECEDEMFVLKQRLVNPKVFIGGKIEEVIKYACPGYQYEILNTSLGGNFIIGDDQPTAVKVLEKIEEVYGLNYTFRLSTEAKPVLVVGRIYSGSDLFNTPVVNYVLNKNVIENNLEYISKEDNLVKIEAVSLQSNGKKLRSIFKGDPQGNIVKRFSIPGLTQAELDEEARELYRKSKVDRFDGDFTSFGFPFVKKGQRVFIQDDNGGKELAPTTNYVDKVSVRFGVSGFRRTISLGEKA